MAYRLYRREQAADSIRRIATEQIQGALDELKSKQLSSAVKVHQVRKHCKKLRALVRLTRPTLGSCYRTENDWFRDTARPLSGFRDSDTMLKTLELLSRQHPRRFSRKACNRIQKNLRQPCQQSDRETDVRQALAETTRRMRTALKRVDDWSLDATGFDAVQGGLRQTYRSARQAMREARRSSSEVAWHEWRKHVKYHWYHCRLLQGLWPALLHARRMEVHRLAEALGDDHDLAVLHHCLKQQPESFGKASQRHTLSELMDHAQQKIETASDRLGQRLFAESTSAFTERMQAYWSVWKSPKKAPSAG